MQPATEHIREILERIPEQPGVYQYFDETGTVIYVGKAKNLRRRVHSYFNKENQTLKTRQLVRNIRDIKYVVVTSEQDAFLLENNLIKQYQPRYNILLKDGKTYPSICITKEQVPRIYKTRTIDRRTGEYFGPYSFSHAADTVLELIHRIFPIRTCNNKYTTQGIEEGKYKVCLKYHLHHCCGICEKKVTSEQYEEYIRAARKIIQGDAHEISLMLESQMRELSDKMQYEQAAEVKRKWELIEKFRSKTIITNTNLHDLDVFGYDEHENNVYISILHIHNGCIVKGQTLEGKKLIDETKEELLAKGISKLREEINSNCSDILVPFIPEFIGENIRINIPTSGDRKKLIELAQQNVKQYKLDRLKQSDKLNPNQRGIRILTELQKLIGLPTIPIQIDSFDNSSTQGSNAVSACIVFKLAKPSKSDYKRFEVKTVEGQDDYATMREVVRRRYAHLIEENKPLPDLIIADGGIGQMHAIREAVEEQLGLHIPIAGLVKDDRHRTNTLLYGFPPMEFGLPVTSDVFRLLTQIQDEVHRFAITYHKAKRSKSQVRSELDDIQGIGPTTKQHLLQHFKSVARIRSAKLEEVQEFAGKSKGSIIYDYFQHNLSR